MSKTRRNMVLGLMVAVVVLIAALLFVRPISGPGQEAPVAADRGTSSHSGSNHRADRQEVDTSGTTDSLAQTSPLTPPSEIEEIGDEVLSGLARSVSSITRRLHLDGMTPAEQPEGYTNRVVRESVDGRFAAYLSIKDRVSRIIVVDRRTGQETVVPPPDAPVYEARSIRELEWGGDGQTLYVVEDATTGVSGMEAYQALTSDQLQKELADNKFHVLYSWSPADSKPVILDQIKGRVLSLAATGGTVTLVNQSEERGWGYVELRTYDNGERVSRQTFHIAINGKSVNHDRPQVLADHKELWFVTRRNKTQSWLAMIDMNQRDPEVRLIAPDVARFVWSPSEDRIVTTSVHGDRIMYQMLHRNSMDQPTMIASEDVGPYEMTPRLVGFSHDERNLYLRTLSEASVRDVDWHTTGIMKLFQLMLPQ